MTERNVAYSERKRTTFKAFRAAGPASLRIVDTGKKYVEAAFKKAGDAVELEAVSDAVERDLTKRLENRLVQGAADKEHIRSLRLGLLESAYAERQAIDKEKAELNPKEKPLFGTDKAAEQRQTLVNREATLHHKYHYVFAKEQKELWALFQALKILKEQRTQVVQYLASEVKRLETLRKERAGGNPDN